MAEILEVVDLCKKDILKDISFKICKGEMTAIMGPSGSGKSTLLYQVSGMDRATSGKILLNGAAIETMSEDELSTLRLTRMGFIFQQMNMLRNLSILDNILLPAYETAKGKTTKKQVRARAELLMEKMNIAELADRKITEVSGGQLQRACICRSMMNKPEILFADEPTGSLNQSAAGEVMEELQKLNSEGATILMVTHDSKVASRCDRILFLLDGKLKGELTLGKWTANISKKQESKVAEWLDNMGW